MHEVSLSTFPIAEMNAKQLERAVLRPYLFASMLSSNDPIYFKECVLHFSSPASVAPHEDWVTGLSFVPGGRFVVSASSSGRVGVWDLGHSEGSEKAPILLASTQLPGKIFSVNVGSTGHNACYRLIVVYDDDTER